MAQSRISKIFISLGYQGETLLSPIQWLSLTILSPTFHLSYQTIYLSVKSFNDVKKDRKIDSQLKSDILLQPHSQNQRNDGGL